MFDLRADVRSKRLLRNYNTLEKRSFKEWTSILELSTRWGFTSIRDLAIRCVKPPKPLQRIVVARKYEIEQWVVPALLDLCARPEPLSLDEARLLKLEDYVLVGTVRQRVRSSSLTVRGAGIRDHIQVRKGELERPPSPVSDPPGTTAPQPRSVDLLPGHWQQDSASFSFSSQIPLQGGAVNFPNSSATAPDGDDWASLTTKKKKGKKAKQSVREE